MDREKIIEGLEAMREFFGFGLPSNTPVFEAYQNILTDTIALLKGQEAEIEQLNRFVNGFSRDAMPVVRCKDCIKRKTNSCLMYWNEIFDDETWDDNWFCADGERR